MVAILTVALLSYVIGSIPTGYWLVKLLKGQDIRTIGSGSTGATNVLRAAGKTAGIFVLLFDLFKGAFCVWLGKAVSDPSNPWHLPEMFLLAFPGATLSMFALVVYQYLLLPPIAGILAMIGHSKSIFLRFQGGKSAATGVGTLIACNTYAGLSSFALFATTIAICKIVSVGSILAGLTCAIFMYAFGAPMSFVVYAAIGGLYVVIRHHTNIKRLFAGTEPKIGQKTAAKGESNTGSSAGADLADVKAGGVGIDKLKIGGVGTNSVNSAGVDIDNVKTDGVKADGVNADGARSDGDITNSPSGSARDLGLNSNSSTGGNVKNNDDGSFPGGTLITGLLISFSLASAIPSPVNSAQPKPTQITQVKNSAAKSAAAKMPAPNTVSNVIEKNLKQSSAPPILTPEEVTNIRVYKMYSPAVVNITAVAAQSPEQVMFGVTPPPDTGSGSIISPEGYILTNNHVINNARMVRVTLFDGASYPAKVIGADPDNDLAVIKIEPGAKKLSSVKFGDSSRLEVGRRVFTIGNPFGLELTMTSGIISSVGRSLATGNRIIKGVLQTDAAINPGNSGGPLLDTQGNVIGITTAIYSKVAQSSGIGFAIPINIVKRVVPQLIAHGAVLRPNLGIAKVFPTDVGLTIVALETDGPAIASGLKGPVIQRFEQNGWTFQKVDNSVADTIIGIDNQRVRSVDDLLSYVETKKPGQVVTLNVLRQGKSIKIPVKLAESKANP